VQCSLQNVRNNTNAPEVGWRVKHLSFQRLWS